jgi:hypothetical protein
LKIWVRSNYSHSLFVYFGYLIREGAFQLRGLELDFKTYKFSLCLTFTHRNKYMEEKFHSKKFSHSHRVSISFQCIRPEFRSVLLSFFLCGISLPYIYFYAFTFTNQCQSPRKNRVRNVKKSVLGQKCQSRL